MELSSAQIKKYQKKSIPQLIKLAEKYFNAFIRKRDSDFDFFTCISCGFPKRIEKMNAGHYMSAGHNGIVRFNEDNVHGQCIHCNLYEHGNLIRYRENLVKKIGQQRVEMLESVSRMAHKWDRFGLIHVIETYKEKCK